MTSIVPRRIGPGLRRDLARDPHEQRSHSRRCEGAVRDHHEGRSAVGGPGVGVLDTLGMAEATEVPEPREAERDTEPAADLFQGHQRRGEERPDSDPRPRWRVQRQQRDGERELDQADPAPRGHLLRPDVAGTRPVPPLISVERDHHRRLLPVRASLTMLRL